MAINAVKQEITPWVFAESMYQINGKPFRFGYGRNYLRVIHDTQIRETLLMTGRQVEKSTTASVKIANNVLLRPFSRNLYVAPMNEQVKTFSRGRLDKLFRYSNKDLIARRYLSAKLTNQVFHKEFTNGAEVYLRNCFEEADNIRGLSIDDIFIDEIQDIIVDALPVIQETYTRSQDKHLFLTGTPKTFSNTIQQEWDASSQADWVVKCPSCRREQVMGTDNVTPESYVCANSKCRKPLDNLVRAFGRWHHRKPNVSKKGFRITQMMIPDIKSADIWKKMHEYPVNRLYNEVLGRSYEQADKPFSEAVISIMSDTNREMIERTAGITSVYANRPTFLGIDWGEGDKNGAQGTGYTVMTVAALTREGNMDILYTKRFTSGDEINGEFQIDYAKRLAQLFSITAIVGDYGGGFFQNQQLRKHFGKKFNQCHYVGSQKKNINHDKEAYKYLIPRSVWLTDFIDACREGEISMPAKNNPEFDWMIKNLKGVYSEYRASKSGRSEDLFYGHPSGQPDDFLHSMVYCWLGMKTHQSEVGVRANKPKKRGSIFAGAYTR